MALRKNISKLHNKARCGAVIPTSENTSGIMNNEKFSLKKRIKSFAYAFAGPEYTTVTLIVIVVAIVVKLILGMFVKKQGELSFIS